MSTGPATPELPGELGALWFLVRRVAGLMDREGEALCRAELGIGLAQFLVLSVVDAHPGPWSQQAIADRLGLTKGTVSRQVDAAATAGLLSVEVAPHTRRENSVTLTAAGTALVRRGDRLLQESRAAMTAAADPDDVAATVRALSALSAVLAP